MADRGKAVASNVEGDFYVDSTCIDCGTCRWMAPDTFDVAPGGETSRVHAQPAEPDADRRAGLALLACPTASIGVRPDRERYPVRSWAGLFPVPVGHEGVDVRHCGYHAEASYGAAAWLVVRPEGNVLVDSPRFHPPLVKALELLGGVRWLFLTHRDDVADHAQYAAHFGCTRVLHRADVSGGTREVEVQPDGHAAFELAPGLRVLPTPGHTRGSMCLLVGDVLFTGDTLAWSRGLRKLVGFRDACWYSWSVLQASLASLRAERFTRVLPGHGSPIHLPAEAMQAALEDGLRWMATQRAYRA